MTRLIVFVHGLGAEKNELDEFWGATPDLLRGHPRIDSSTFDLEFWPYLTNKRPNWLLRIRLGRDRGLASLEGLGKILWSRLRLWMQQEQYSDIKLLGHSLGGLIVASAIGYGLRHCPEDENIIQALSGVALVVTPLRGSALADKAKLICRNNKQIMGLTTDSASRELVVNRFIQEALQKHKLPLTIFTAPEDATLQENDLIAPLPKNIKYSLEALSDGHSGCINKLKVDHPNLEILVNWLISQPEPESNLSSSTDRESHFKASVREDNVSNKNIATSGSSKENNKPSSLIIPPRIVSRLLFKSKISGHLQSEEALEELCKDFSTSSIGLEVAYVTKIRSKKYKKDSDLNSHLEDSVGNLYDHLKDQDKLIAFIDWLSKTSYSVVKRDLGLNETN